MGQNVATVYLQLILVVENGMYIGTIGQPK